MTPSSTGARRTRHSHHDAPDTAAAFDRIASMPDGPERDALRQEVVRAWAPMAHRLAGRYRDRGESLEDLQQTAALGLVKAVSRYDPARGAAFESFAVPTIVGEIKRHFRDHMWDLHVPRRVQELRNQVRASSRELLLTQEGRSPSVAQIAAHSGLTQENVLLGMEAMESYSTLSLDAELPCGDDGYSLQDTLGRPEPGFDLVVRRESVRPLLRKLPERERRILYLRFFCDMTQSRISEELGISQMHVSRLIAKSCEQICRRIEDARAESVRAETARAA
ncbi:SigB/SigF/SigG family RNA polymerase sigma factor [Streptomyces sp. N2-109]|uniref:SigB/SigF/SigG family RNA polymerase sigma factor n=1 Tax=Streptomyces gossypii TaxID=2883101 RepID=A0ABT2JUR1_9ACTN|nr:SigB/SigF/SigG family RNA polymerase sigma factor [Streptomyces gossypii]MCT2591629.1 SigB/SigF/SigG family RNA polymerase sigma factor [Streptomyces gossypii]